MELEVGGVCEAFIAVGALKRSLPRMGAFMLNTIKKRTQNVKFRVYKTWTMCLNTTESQ